MGLTAILIRIADATMVASFIIVAVVNVFLLPSHAAKPTKPTGVGSDALRSSIPRAYHEESYNSCGRGMLAYTTLVRISFVKSHVIYAHQVTAKLNFYAANKSSMMLTKP